MEITIGKIDYNEIGKKNCRASVDIKLNSNKKGIQFTAIGNIWNHIETNCYIYGQCLDEIQKFFPKNKRFNRLVEIWKEYHLNDLQAGTDKQMDALKGFNTDYDKQCEYLDSINLLYDDGYKYGTSWKYKQIPNDVINEIKDFISNGF